MCWLLARNAVNCVTIILTPAFKNQAGVTQQSLHAAAGNSSIK
jgi:hypothetical protein